MKISYSNCFSSADNISIFKVFVFTILTMASYANCSHVSAQCPISATVYGYAPSLSVNATLLTAFSLIMVVQLIQGVAWKTWGFMIIFVLGSLCEVIGKLELLSELKTKLMVEKGYSGRLMLHSNPWNYNR